MGAGWGVFQRANLPPIALIAHMIGCLQSNRAKEASFFCPLTSAH
jgi:hypothetical protein